MNRYRAAIWIIKGILLIIASPLLIPLIILTLPFQLYDWLKKKANEVENDTLLKKVDSLDTKYSEGLSMTEFNSLKRLYQQNNKF